MGTCCNDLCGHTFFADPSLPAVEEGRKAAFAVRGEKLAVAATRHYLTVVLADDQGGGGGGGPLQVGWWQGDSGTN